MLRFQIRATKQFKTTYTFTIHCHNEKERTIDCHSPLDRRMDGVHLYANENTILITRFCWCDRAHTKCLKHTHKRRNDFICLISSQHRSEGKPHHRSAARRNWWPPRSATRAGPIPRGLKYLFRQPKKPQKTDFVFC